MTLALLLHLSKMRAETFDGSRIYTAAEVYQAARDWCKKHGREYPGDELTKHCWNDIKQPALRRELGLK
jgi:hypothetical protein